jgi:hypothetical protein
MSDLVATPPSGGEDSLHDGGGAATPTTAHAAHRRRRPRPSKRGALGSLVAVLLAIALLAGLLAASGWPAQASTAQSLSVTARAQQGLAAAQSSSGEPSCDPASGQSAPSAAQVEVVPGQQENVGLEIFKMLGEGAFSFGEEEGLGWLLSVIGGQEPSLNPAEIDQQFDQVNAKLDALSKQESDDCTAILATLAALKNQVDRDAYDNLVTPMGVQIGLVNTYDQDYQAIVTALGQNGGRVDALSSSLKDDMRDMLSGGPSGIRNIINTMNVLEAGDQPGAKAMVSFFSQILTDKQGYDPYQTHIFPAAFVNGAAAQQGYYAAIIERAVYIYSNVAHLDFTDGDYTHQPDPDGVASLVNLAQKDVQSWTVSFADGPAGDGKWVSQNKNQGIGPIPANTVLDYRVQNRPLLWTDAPVGLNGDQPSPAPYYCGTTAAYCYADQFNSAGQVGSTTLVPSSPQPLGQMITAQDYDGLSGWRVPTSADWTALQAGATGGLTAWGASHQLGSIFAAQKLTSHYGGLDQALTTIAPVLVNTATTASPVYGVLSSTDPAANALTLEKPDLGGSSQDDVAGRLFLTMDYQPTTPPTPFTDNTATAAVQAGSSPAVSTAPARSASVPALLTSADTPAPATFSTPVACSANSTYTVPAGVGSVKITATGGAGAPGEVQNKASAPGGVGGVVTETVPVTAGTALYVQVGGAGSAGGSRAGGIAGGGTGGISRSEKTTSGDYSGGGGGASGVSTTPDCTHWLVVAGGGGGGGAGLEAVGHDPQFNGGRGGDGCATTITCQTATDGSQPSGYTISAGHAGGSAPDNRGGDTGRNPAGNPYGTAGGPGTTLQGGNGGTNNSSYIGGGGGGGGGGYFGGGGGAGSGWNAAGGGGGGGASFAIPGAISVSYGLGQAGQNGSVTITPIAKPSLPIKLAVSPPQQAWDQPLPVTFTATVPQDATGDIAFTITTGANSSGGAFEMPVGKAPIRHGTATLASPMAPMVGDNYVQASYSGDAHYLATTTDNVPFVVTKQTPTMQLTVSGTVLKAGQSPTSLVVQISPSASGSVEFYNDINGGCEGKTGPGAACQAEGTATLNRGYATLTSLTVPLQPGRNYLHATYAGDSEQGAYSEFNPGTSNVVTVTVGP